MTLPSTIWATAGLSLDQTIATPESVAPVDDFAVADSWRRNPISTVIVESLRLTDATVQLGLPDPVTASEPPPHDVMSAAMSVAPAAAASSRALV